MLSKLDQEQQERRRKQMERERAEFKSGLPHKKNWCPSTHEQSVGTEAKDKTEWRRIWEKTKTKSQRWRGTGARGRGGMKEKQKEEWVSEWVKQRAREWWWGEWSEAEVRGRESERAEFSWSLGGHFSVTLDSVKIPVTLRLTAERGRRRKTRRTKRWGRDERKSRGWRGLLQYKYKYTHFTGNTLRQ